MMTSSNGNIFRVTDPLCGEFTGPGEFPAKRPVTRSFDVFIDLRLNKRLSKQPWGWWFETPSWSLWRHCNVRLSSGHWWPRIGIFQCKVTCDNHVKEIFHSIMGTSPYPYLQDSWGPLYWYGLTLIPEWISNHMHNKCGMKLHSIHSQTSTSIFENG